jgi:mannose-6-phosphate isomerase-like protein (cupin superfamily)
MQIKNYLDADYWYQMYGSQAIGLPLVKKDGFAADMLNFAPNEKTSLHTHEGDHILFGVEGSGWIDCGDETQPIIKGTCYFIDGSQPHRVRAGNDGLFLLSIANKHQPVDSEKRLVIINA